ncbi:GNAT family N-acetyltransferase [Uliginosibacterium sp. H3]|uniref:GNAT family N-acetyltransferase n=1 Tax=Uliginosibacterium silvisoli TaxID=3114758 RepID=A0ABU6K7X5_9RHOO|nr:GNAT family N-acetyltransferase [Uliginosibacterium sp. H3]
MHIRLALIDEAARVIELYREYDRPPDIPPSPERAREIFNAINAFGHVAVAEDEGVIVGSYSMYICPNLSRGGRPFGVIENVIVAAASRHQGIGKALMKHAQEAAVAADCYKLMLSTGCMRQENHLFYMSCGFIGDKLGFQIRYDGT